MAADSFVFIGGGNMARAIIGGLLNQGTAASTIHVVEPDAQTRNTLHHDLGVSVHENGQEAVAAASFVVWAVKPQVLKEVATALRPFLKDSLHLSIAAGVSTESLKQWLATSRIVRAMPNTPALIGKGMTGLFAPEAVTQSDRDVAAHVASAFGKIEWVDAESKIDAVTALSGSGPAYVFYFLEAMQQAGQELGLDPQQAYRLAVATFEGATALAAASSEAPKVLRARVTSKGGTTYAATTTMDETGVKSGFIQAMKACEHRAAEMAREFG